MTERHSSELARRLGPQAPYGARLAEAFTFVERGLRLRAWVADLSDAEWQELGQSATTDLRESIAGDGDELRRRLLHLAAELVRSGLAVAHEARTLYDEAELAELGDGR